MRGVRGGKVGVNLMKTQHIHAWGPQAIYLNVFKDQLFIYHLHGSFSFHFITLDWVCCCWALRVILVGAWKTAVPAAVQTVQAWLKRRRRKARALTAVGVEVIPDMFWQRIWQPPALVLRSCLRWNWKLMNFFKQRKFQDKIMLNLLHVVVSCPSNLSFY